MSSSKKDVTDDIFEFRIKFQYPGSDFINERHFTATDSSGALEMFNFASKKDDMEVDIVGLEKWNRWANRWESA